MYSDTHFHFHYLAEKNGLEWAADILNQMAESKVYFGMDIGTECNDLLSRRDIILKTMQLLDEGQRKQVEDFMYFSAGIWPSAQAISNRYKCMEELEKEINAFKNDGGIFSKKLVAIGEGGLDHHWNPSGVDSRDEKDFDEDIFNGERELFEMQLLLSSKMNLPFIVHSRDAYKETYECIKKAGWHKGIIHCFSYGLEEAKSFLDSGWYISFSGSITYTKKSKMEEMKKLISYIPDDRILIETDSPYLAPVPMRGNPCNPNFVRHTYDFAAAFKNISTEELSFLVDSNIKKLFNL